MTDDFKKDINVPSKEIIIKFSDGYCIVLENNEVSIRENAFTKYCIEYGKQTNELLEFVKELYLDKKAKEQECEELKREIAFGNNGKLSDKIRAIVFKDLNAENSKYKQALDEIKESLIPVCDSCKEYYYNQHCEDCDTGYIKDIIGKVRE